jgi:hypothetical protein
VLTVSSKAPIGNFYYYISGSYDNSTGYEVSKKLNRKTREDWVKKLSRIDLYGFTPESIYLYVSASPYYLKDTGLWDHTTHTKYKASGKTGYHITDKLEAGVSAFYNRTKMENSVYHPDLRSIYSFNDSLPDASGTHMRNEWQRPDTSYILRNMSSRWPENNDFSLSPYINYKGVEFSLKINAFYYEQYSKFAAYIDPAEKVLAYNRDESTMTWSIWTSRTYGFNIYPTYRITKDQKLSFALSYYINSHIEEEQAYNSDSIATIQHYGAGKFPDEIIEAAYLTVAAEDEIRVTRNTDLTLGVSYDAQNLFNFQRKEKIDGSRRMIRQYQAMDDSMLWGTRDSFNPVAGIITRVTDACKLRTSLSYKSAFPTMQAYSNTRSGYKVTTDSTSRDVKIKAERSLNGNLGFEIEFFDKCFTFGADYFFSKYYDKIIKFYQTRTNDYVYRNIDSAALHGAEFVLNYDSEDTFEFANISAGLTHTWLYSRNITNQQDSFINKGRRFEKLPEHKFSFDFRMRFKTNTSFFLFGYIEYNQIIYSMKYAPEKELSDIGYYTNSCFKAQRIHDPLMIDAKVSQKINYGGYEFELYLLCKNILDDYLADPFNPGPGRTFYFGLKANY